MEFADQVVLVTGAGGRIGRAICRQFAAAGAKVACCDIDPERAASTAAVIREAGDTAVAVPGDVSVEQDVEAHHLAGRRVRAHRRVTLLWIEGGPEHAHAHDGD